jgi:hypothetical protein
MGGGGATERWRIAGLWACLALFVLRVLGQLEVLLLAPPYLPPFAAWESGLVPYAALLPAQILLIAWMAVITAEHTRGAGVFWVARAATRQRLRALACVYALVMALRFAITVALPPHTLLERGLIPILAHWDLALFLVLVSRTPQPLPQTFMARAVAASPRAP